MMIKNSQSFYKTFINPVKTKTRQSLVKFQISQHQIKKQAKLIETSFYLAAPKQATRLI